MKNLRDYINIVEEHDSLNEGEFANADAPEGEGPWSRAWDASPGRFAKRAAFRGLKSTTQALSGSGTKFKDVNGTEGYEFSPDWNSVGYAGLTGQKVQKIDGVWVADNGEYATDPSVAKKLEQMALNDMVQSRQQPRGGWQQDSNPAHQAALSGGTATTSNAATKTPLPSKQTPQEGTTGTYNGARVIFRNGQWEYM